MTMAAKYYEQQIQDAPEPDRSATYGLRGRSSSTGSRELLLGADRNGDDYGACQQHVQDELTWAAQSNPDTTKKKRGGPKAVVATTEEDKPLRIENGYTEKGHVESIKIVPRVFARRWIMVFLFASYSLSNAYQWIHLNIIGNILLRYYNESLPGTAYQQQVAIDWLSMVYMLAYIPLIIPATYLLDKKGLRVVGILGTLLNCAGAWLKCASVGPDRFFVLVAGQTICAVAQIFILGIPARLAAVWFGPNEVSTATAIGVFGNQLGCAVGFLVPPMLVPNHPDLDVVGERLSYMFYGTAAITTALFILVVVVFKKAPPVPPSQAQAAMIEASKDEDYFSSLRRLYKNRGFLLLMVTYGINTGSYYAIGTLLNPIVLSYFPGMEENAGRIGLTLVLAGVLGSIIAGVWLDKTKLFKMTTVTIYFLSFAGMVAFTATLGVNKIWIVFLFAGVLGFFMTGYLPVGFEFAAEITYPESEGTSSGLLNASAQTFGIILTLGMGALMNKVSILAGNISVSGALFIGTIGTALIRSELRRQKAGEANLNALLGDDLVVNVKIKDIDEKERLRVDYEEDKEECKI